MQNTFLKMFMNKTNILFITLTMLSFVWRIMHMYSGKTSLRCQRLSFFCAHINNQLPYAVSINFPYVQVVICIHINPA